MFVYNKMNSAQCNMQTRVACLKQLDSTILLNAFGNSLTCSQSIFNVWYLSLLTWKHIRIVISLILNIENFQLHSMLWFFKRKNLFQDLINLLNALNNKYLIYANHQAHQTHAGLASWRMYAMFQTVLKKIEWHHTRAFHEGYFIL